MNLLLSTAKKLRHAPGLRRLDPLWRALRRPYLWLLDPRGRGVRVSVGGRPIRLPTAVIGMHPDWSLYEPETVSALGDWLDRHPAGTQVLDVGASIGIVVTFVLQVSPRTEVYAIESDLASLKAVDVLVPPAAHARLHRLRTLLGPEHASDHDLAAALAATRRDLAATPAASALADMRYVCLGDADTASIPTYSLDRLFADRPATAPLLIKIDVEGAELMVLRGARRLLARARPILLLSVHPGALVGFGQSPDDVAGFLRENGYRWHLLARDHEEHWWCEPTSA